QMARILAVMLLPESDEAEDLFGLFSLTQVGVGIAKRVALGVLRQKGEHGGLRSTAHRDVLALHLRVFSVIAPGMEIEIEGSARKELLWCHRAVPGRDQAGRAGVVKARRILREVAVLRDRI